MDLESTRVLRGPNKWSNVTLIEAILVSSPVAADSATAASMQTNLESDGSAASAIATILAKVQPNLQSEASVVAELALTIQRAIGCEIEFSAIKETSRPDAVRVLVQYDEEIIGLEALKLVLALLLG